MDFDLSDRSRVGQLEHGSWCKRYSVTCLVTGLATTTICTGDVVTHFSPEIKEQFESNLKKYMKNIATVSSHLDVHIQKLDTMFLEILIYYKHNSLI